MLLYFLLTEACVHQGTPYQIGDIIQPNCTTRCTCQNDFKFYCQPQECLLDGLYCYAWGEPHYGTFDKRRFDFQGDCEYVLSQPCDSDDFIITGSNTAINEFVSATSAVRIVLPSKDLEIFLTRGGGGTIEINNDIIPNNGDGLVYNTDGVYVMRAGGHPYVRFNIRYPVVVYWDGSQRVVITASSSWQGQLCGLCGNYNNDPDDDFMLPNGTLTTSVNEFGNEWLYANTTPNCGELQPIPVCTDSVMNEAQTRCDELNGEVFQVCHSIVDPAPFVDGCVLDYCLCSMSDREECYCNALSVYAAVCATSDIIIPNWRDSFCRKYSTYIKEHMI